MITFRSLNDLDATEGTVKLLDNSHILKNKANTDIVLIPQPADDPNDPLNWPLWRKSIVFVVMSMFCIQGGWAIGGISTAIVLVIKEFHTDLNTTIDGLINWSVLLLGLGVFFWVPAILHFGTRPSLLMANIILFATLIWSATTHSFHSLEAARIIAAFALCCGEVLPAIVVKDIFFLHERGWWMGIYMYLFQAGPCALIIGSSFLITAKGWRWQFWLTAIFTGVDILLIFFFFPETQYYRNLASDLVPANVSSSAGKEVPTVEAQEQLSAAPSKKTFLEMLKPWSGLNPGIEKSISFFSSFIRPWPLAVYPAVIYAFLVFSCNLACLLNVVNTAASVFQNPPYNMNPGVQSLIYVSPIIGGAIGGYCGGGLTDLIIQWRTRKNNGIFEPEDRLIAALIPLFVVPAGELMYGLGVAHTTSWAVPFIGLGLIFFGLSSIPAITISYVVDCYFPLAPDLMLLIIGLKNVFGFGFAYAIIPWIRDWGYSGAFGTTAAIYFFVNLLGLPLWFWGKQIRHATAKWKIVM